MFSRPGYSLRRRDLERTDQPYGRSFSVRPGRGHVAPWLSPSRRGPHAECVGRRVRGTLVVVGLVLAWLGTVHVEQAVDATSSALGVLTIGLGAALFAGGVGPGKGLWWRIVLPSTGALGLLLWALAAGYARPDTQAWCGQAVALVIAFAVALEALRVDAVRRMPPPPGSQVGARERIQSLHLSPARVGSTMTALIVSALVVFGLIVLQVL